MTDYFALLGELRRPWLDAAALKEKFLSLSASVHPDRTHEANAEEKASASQRFAELNAAFKCLCETKDRLRHLLELETGAKPKDLQEIPPDLADLFIEIANLRREVDAFLAEQRKVQSPLLRVQLLERAQEFTDRLNLMQRKINERQEALTTELKNLDEDWQRTATNAVARAGLLAKLEELFRLFSFYNRWNSQIREAIVQLML